jgi:hypothetical protein
MIISLVTSMSRDVLKSHMQWLSADFNRTYLRGAAAPEAPSEDKAGRGGSGPESRKVRRQREVRRVCHKIPNADMPPYCSRVVYSPALHPPRGVLK